MKSFKGGGVGVCRNDFYLTGTLWLFLGQINWSEANEVIGTSCATRAILDARNGNRWNPSVGVEMKHEQIQ